MKIFEFKEFINNTLIEHAQITHKSDKFYQLTGKIIVNGGGLNGNRREHGKPHFKLIKNDGEEIRITIPQKNEKDLTINDIDILDNMDISIKLKKNILDWLKDVSFKSKEVFNSNTSNLKYAAFQWNELNEEDKNIKIINLDIYEK